MKRKSEGQEQHDCQEVVGGYRKEIEALSWPIKLPGVTSNPPDFTRRDLVLQQPLLDSSTPAHFSPVAGKKPSHLL